MRQRDLFSALHSSAESIDTEFKSARGGLPGSFWETYRAMAIAEPARKNKKLPVEKLRRILQQLCVGQWLSAAEIARLVDRDAEKLQSRFLTAMVKEGTLELRHPDVRNRPDQAYRTVAGKTL